MNEVPEVFPAYPNAVLIYPLAICIYFVAIWCGSIGCHLCSLSSFRLSKVIAIAVDPVPSCDSASFFMSICGIIEEIPVSLW